MIFLVHFKVKGDFKKTEKYLESHRKFDIDTLLNKYGEIGVTALSNATPVRTGLTSRSWRYEIVYEPEGPTLYWINDNVSKDWANVAILLQYGHGTGTGGYVRGIDYINPALAPIFENMVKEFGEEVKSK